MIPAAESIAKIDACLPQTQCTLCGYPRCRDYAKAVHDGSAQINRCAPGGENTIGMLANLLRTEALPLDEECDHHPGRQVAIIRKNDCIGCTLCLAPCPVDAIIGAAKHMHTVAAQLCTGCRLCVPYCPVDCIEMIEYAPLQPGATWPEFADEEPSRWRTLAKRHFERGEQPPQADPFQSADEMRRQIREAVNRTRNKRWRKSRKTFTLKQTRRTDSQ